MVIVRTRRVKRKKSYRMFAGKLAQNILAAYFPSSFCTDPAASFGQEDRHARPVTSRSLRNSAFHRRAGLFQDLPDLSRSDLDAEVGATRLSLRCEFRSQRPQSL